MLRENRGATREEIFPILDEVTKKVQFGDDVRPLILEPTLEPPETRENRKSRGATREEIRRILDVVVVGSLDRILGVQVQKLGMLRVLRGYVVRFF